MPQMTPEQIKVAIDAAKKQGLGMPGAAAFNAEQRARAEAANTEPRGRVSGGDPTPPSTGRLSSAARGVARGAGGLLDLVGLVGSGVGGSIAKGAELLGGPERPELQPSPSFADRAADATGIPAATDRLGKDIEYGAEGIVGSVPFAPLAAGGAAKIGVPKAFGVAADLLAGGAGGVVQGDMAEQGHPWLGATAAIAVAPMSAGGGAGLRKAGEAAVDAVRVMTPEALAVARANQLSRGAMVTGASEVKRRTPDVVRAIEALREAKRQQQGLPGRISSRQVMESLPFGRGGRWFTDQEIQLTRTDPDYAREAARSFADNAESLSERWNRIAGVDPNYAEFIDSFDQGFEARKVLERDKWSGMRKEDQPVFNMADVINDAERMVGGTHFKSGDVPVVLRKLVDPRKRLVYMDLPRFQELRSSLLGVIRDARLNPTSSNKHGAEMAGQVLEQMQRKMDDFAAADVTGKSAAWQEARRVTLENNIFYSEHSPVIRMLDAGGKPQNLFSAIRNAKGRRGARTNPAEEARRLVRIAEQTPGQMENLRALAAEDLFFEGLNPSAVKVPDKTLRQNEAMYREIFGQHYDEVMEILDLSKLATKGSPGTAVESYRTGSNVSPAAFLAGLAKATRNPIEASVEGAMEALGKVNGRELEWQKIVRTAIEQPEFLRVLLEMPTERALPAWQVKWRQLVKRSSAREAARAGAREAVRSAGPDEK